MLFVSHAISALLLLCIAVQCALSAHFRGAMIMVRPIPGKQVSVCIYHSIAIHSDL